jgi:hypothetical protein
MGTGKLARSTIRKKHGSAAEDTSPFVTNIDLGADHIAG